METALFLLAGIIISTYTFLSVLVIWKLIKDVKLNEKDIQYLNQALGQAESQIQNDIRKFHEDSILHTNLKIKELDKQIKKLNEEVNRKFSS